MKNLNEVGGYDDPIRKNIVQYNSILNIAEKFNQIIMSLNNIDGTIDSLPDDKFKHDLVKHRENIHNSLIQMRNELMNKLDLNKDELKPEDVANDIFTKRGGFIGGLNEQYYDKTKQTIDRINEIIKKQKNYDR
jgi:hypothetical protein